MDDSDRLIQSAGEAKHVIEHMEQPAVIEKKHKYHHAAVASQAIKLVNSALKDPFVKAVMTRRILAVAITGHERSHLSIALELGSTERNVRQAEIFGIGCIEEMMKKVELPDFIGKFNSERAVGEAVHNMANSTKRGLPKKGVEYAQHV